MEYRRYSDDAKINIKDHAIIHECDKFIGAYDISSYMLYLKINGKLKLIARPYDIFRLERKIKALKDIPIDKIKYDSLPL